MKYLLPLVLAALIFGCNETTVETGQVSVGGIATYKSPLLGNDSAALKAQLVLVTDNETGSVYELVTDSLGRFLLPGFPAGKMFSVKTNAVRDNSNEHRAVYTGLVEGAVPDVQNIALSTTLKDDSTGLLLNVRDEYGGNISGGTVLIYTSRKVAELDTGFAGHGAYARLLTNHRGSCLAMQLPPESLYVKASFEAGSGAIRLRSAIKTLNAGKIFLNDTTTNVNTVMVNMFVAR